MVRILSDEWLNLYKKALNENTGFKQAGKTWDKGPNVLIINKNPDLDLQEDVYIWLDLHKGECRDVKIVSKEEGEQGAFKIRGDYFTWKQIISGKLDPVKAIVKGKLKIKGNLMIIVRYSKAAKEMVKSAQSVPTEYLD